MVSKNIFLQFFFPKFSKSTQNVTYVQGEKGNNNEGRNKRYYLILSRPYRGSKLAKRIFLLFPPMSPGFDPRSRHLCALGFQSKLASTGFSSGTPVFLLHLKLDQKDLKSDQRALLESSDTHCARLHSLKMAYLFHLFNLKYFSISELTFLHYHECIKGVLHPEPYF